MNKKRIAVIICSLVLVFGLSVFLYNNSSIAKENKSDKTTANSDISSENKKNDLAEQTEKEKADEVISMNMSLVKMSLEEIEQASALVVYGTVTDISEAFKDEEGCIYKDYYISPEKVLRGDASSKNNKVTVRLEGGLVDGTLLQVENGPDLQEGSKYLLFLKEPLGKENENADYYFLTGETQGIYDSSDENSGKDSDNADIVFTSQYTKETVTFKRLENDLVDINIEYPAEESKARDIERIKNNLKLNYDEGLLLKEDYERYVDELE